MDRQTLYFTGANFRHDYFQDYFFAKLEKQSPPLIHPGGSRRRQQYEETCGFLMWIQKCIDLHMDRQTLYFTVANVRHDYF